jgi:DNA-binding response OmpR family regulator
MSRLLVIDDDPTITRLLEEHLSNEGHEVTSAHLAEEGFKQATSKPPELIFLDIMLPDATGFQIAGRLRENPVTQSIPIIMMTGAARFPNQQQIGKRMGANDYILKPFNVLELGDRVHRLIEFHRQQPSFAELIPNKPISDPPVIQTNQENTSEGTNLRETTAIKPDQTPFDSILPLEPMAEPENSPSHLFIVAVLFMVHLLIGGAAARFDGIQTITLIAASWALALGLLTGVSAIFRIPIEARKLLWILGWSSLPILARAAAGLFGILPNPATFPGSFLWLKPLDIFELAAVVIFAISYQRLLKVSVLKSVFPLLFIALAWVFCARGYLRPF